MFTQRAPLPRRRDGGAFAFMLKVISRFVDELADGPPGFYFQAIFEALGMIGCVLDKIKSAASRDLEIPQFQLGDTEPIRITARHARETEIDLRIPKQHGDLILRHEAVQQRWIDLFMRIVMLVAAK